MKKHKVISALTAATLIAAIGTLPVYADNEITEEIPETVTEEVAEEPVNDDESSVSEDSEEFEDMDAAMGLFGDLFSEALMNGEWTISEDVSTEESSPDYFNDPYYDTDGNASLIIENDIIYNNDEMQFIAVTTKDGHVFYILINYLPDGGEDNVYFLNKVDTFDLYSLLYTASEDDENAVDPVDVAVNAEMAAERINGEKNNTSTNITKKAADTTETAVTGTDLTTDNTANQKPSVMNSGMIKSFLMIGIVVALGVIGFIVLKLLKKPKKGVSPADDMYDDDDGDLEFSGDEDF